LKTILAAFMISFYCLHNLQIKIRANQQKVSVALAGQTLEVLHVFRRSPLVFPFSPNYNKIPANHQRLSVALAGQTRGAIGLSLIFCFFCIKAKEKAIK
jgi:hypothetical protein